MTTQQMETLREHVARVLVDFRPSRTATLDEGIRETADAVLAAIGLDDLNHATQRMMNFRRFYIDGIESWANVAPEVEEVYHHEAWGLLLAALDVDEEEILSSAAP